MLGLPYYSILLKLGLSRVGGGRVSVHLSKLVAEQGGRKEGGYLFIH